MTLRINLVSAPRRRANRVPPSGWIAYRRSHKSCVERWLTVGLRCRQCALDRFRYSPGMDAGSHLQKFRICCTKRWWILTQFSSHFSSAFSLNIWQICYRYRQRRQDTGIAKYNKNLCGRDGRTICGPHCVPKSTDALSACRKVHPWR